MIYLGFIPEDHS